MLKLAVVEVKKSNCYWWTFINEFNNRSYNGRTFQTMDEAVDYARDTVVYGGEMFDLMSISKLEYSIVDSLSAY